MTGVFVDSAAIFAALVRNDSMHDDAAATLERLLQLDIALHSSNYVLLETQAVLLARVGIDAARRVEHDLRPVLRLTWIDETLHDRASRRFDLRGRRGLSLVDCTSFVVMEELGLRHVFTYDADFSAEGFTTVGQPDELGELNDG